MSQMRCCLSVWNILALFALVTFGSCSNPVSVQHKDHDWDYKGDHDPTHWAELDPEFIKCAEGEHQSPIDIETYKTNEVSARLEFYYKASSVELINNGHTVQAIPDKDNYIIALGKSYHMRQIHFHDPSEHHLDGVIYPMEIHMVHTDSSGGLAVVALLVKEGPSNSVLGAIWSGLPHDIDEHSRPDGKLDMLKLIPDMQDIYHYQGSLTTPPCTEGVEWFVIGNPIRMSKEQISEFKKLHPGNSRPIQDPSPVEVIH